MRLPWGGQGWIITNTLGAFLLFFFSKPEPVQKKMNLSNKGPKTVSLL